MRLKNCHYLGVCQNIIGGVQKSPYNMLARDFSIPENTI